MTRLKGKVVLIGGGTRGLALSRWLKSGVAQLGVEPPL
jgi:hypothetical protein